MDNSDRRVWKVFTKNLYVKEFADSGYIKKGLSDELFHRSSHLIHGLKTTMTGRLMPMWNKTLL